mmetsp:Transcript_91691/g.213249  ORF Transcript_91691/g.213249 Transcript_91691/m.213249 type:complete len:240 (+) Transcript_91691:3267-3986(+)
MSCGFVSRALASGSDIMAAFSQSISTPASREASSPNSFSAWRDSSWSFRTFLYSSSLAWAASKREASLAISSLALSLASGAMDSTSFPLTSSSRRALLTVPRAVFTARSVSRMALICKSLSSSTASMASGAARMVTFSASSSAANNFSSSFGSMAWNFSASWSSFCFSAAVLGGALLLLARGGWGSESPGSSRPLRASARIRSAIARTLASRSVSPGRGCMAASSALTNCTSLAAAPPA